MEYVVIGVVVLFLLSRSQGAGVTPSSLIAPGAGGGGGIPGVGAPAYSVYNPPYVAPVTSGSGGGSGGGSAGGSGGSYPSSPVSGGGASGGGALSGGDPYTGGGRARIAVV